MICQDVTDSEEHMEGLLSHSDTDDRFYTNALEVASEKDKMNEVLYLLSMRKVHAYLYQ